MRRATTLYRSSIGKKVLMAATGVVLYGFVVVHMIGNLKVYAGPEKFNHYAEFLRTVLSGALGEMGFLWIARVVMLGAVGLHVLMAWQLTRVSWSARTTKYAKNDDVSFAYASRTMRWGGVVLAAFVVYHLLHLTVGSVHPGFEHGDAYGNVVRGFSVWWVSVAYVVAMVPLGFHMYHGLWSMTQTLAIDVPVVVKWRRPVAAAIALAVVAGNISVPVAVLTGMVR